ncbi:MAG: phosphate signaling complex protein PhoU [Peptococcaceae bacterium]|nr:phosphate signaling complex protein PhoU [Peptococcaceae bacterium]MBQ5702747.1 phosphate signaling complex protein PhoU [Peptococcaceae bacterium]
MRNKFDEQLELLNRELIEMGALCERSLKIIVDELLSGDMTHNEEVIHAESEIDQKERDIEQLCLKLLLQQQPVAGDLRQISAALKMITDMERIGDQTQDIAEILNYGTLGALYHDHVLVQMAKAAMQMVTGSVDAYVRNDASLAEAVMRQDDEVDRLFLREREELIAIIAADPQSGEIALDQMMIAKYFERIGDHAVNIANWVYFSITGSHGRDA